MVERFTSKRSSSFSRFTNASVRRPSVSKLLQNSMQPLVYSVASPFSSKNGSAQSSPSSDEPRSMQTTSWPRAWSLASTNG